MGDVETGEASRPFLEMFHGSERCLESLSTFDLKIQPRLNHEVLQAMMKAAPRCQFLRAEDSFDLSRTSFRY